MKRERKGKTKKGKNRKEPSEGKVEWNAGCG